MRELPTAPPEQGIVLPPADPDDGIHVVVEPVGVAWSAAYYVDTTGPAPEIVEVRIVPRDGFGQQRDDRDPGAMIADVVGHKPRRGRVEQPLSARSLQRLHPGREIAKFQSIIGAFGTVSRAELGISREMLQPIAARRRRNRPDRDRWLATVAALYVEAVGRGSTKPVKVVQEALNASPSDAPLSTTKVRDLIATARKAGLLERPEAGDRRRPGGQLTEKAEQLLAAPPPS